METCCICKKELKGYGNNAEPFRKGVCCNKCNSEFVIPSRLVYITIFTADKVKAVKELRKITGAGSLDCKTALVQCDWDVERAIEWIRKHCLC